MGKVVMICVVDNSDYQLYRIQRRHWIKQGELTGLSRLQVESMMDEIISRTPGVIERIYPSSMKLQRCWLRSLTRITYLSKLIGIRSLAAWLQLH